MARQLRFLHQRINKNTAELHGTYLAKLELGCRRAGRLTRDGDGSADNALYLRRLRQYHRRNYISPGLTRQITITTTNNNSDFELRFYVPLDIKQVILIRRRSSQPISWSSTEETKPNTSKARIHYGTQNYYNTK